MTNVRYWGNTKGCIGGTDAMADRYVKQKGSIAGPMLKIPFMGPFIQAIHPKFDAYLTQWASGPLSCVSVFHK
jgi:hypothetical protein